MMLRHTGAEGMGQAKSQRAYQRHNCRFRVNGSLRRRTTSSHRTRSSPMNRSRMTSPLTGPCRSATGASPCFSSRIYRTRRRGLLRRRAFQNQRCRLCSDIRKLAWFLKCINHRNTEARRNAKVRWREKTGTSSQKVPLVSVSVVNGFSFYFFSNFFQSDRNLSIPMSVSGCFTSWSITLKGIVEMWAPARAASTTWSGFRTLATITSVPYP